MIGSIYIKNYLSFDTISLSLNPGLNVFTGSSGAGKSIFFKAVLSIFAKESKTLEVGEVVIENDFIINEKFDINKDDFSIKQISNQKTRYYLNNLLISKKELNSFCSQFFMHLHLKDLSDFEDKNLLNLIDSIGSIDDEYKKIKSEFDTVIMNFINYKKN